MFLRFTPTVECIDILFLLDCSVQLHCVDMPHFVYPFPVIGQLDSYQCLAVVNKASLKIDFFE